MRVETDAKGRKQIDVSELTRVYGQLKTAEPVNETVQNLSMNGNDTPTLPVLTAIVTYAVKVGMPIVCLTNGKVWRFYFSWIEGTSVSDRIFCETDIENQEDAISDLEKYLLKSNVVSGEAELNAEIALEEKGGNDQLRN